MRRDNALLLILVIYLLYHPFTVEVNTNISIPEKSLVTIKNSTITTTDIKSFLQTEVIRIAGGVLTLKEIIIIMLIILFVKRQVLKNYWKQYNFRIIQVLVTVASLYIVYHLTVWVNGKIGIIPAAITMVTFLYILYWIVK